MFSGIAFVSDLPVIEEKGGVIVFTYVSGDQRREHALPLWLARIVNARVSEIIAECDSRRLAA